MIGSNRELNSFRMEFWNLMLRFWLVVLNNEFDFKSFVICKMNFFYLKMFWTFENVWRLKMYSFFLHDHEFIGKPIAVNTEVPNLLQYIFRTLSNFRTIFPLSFLRNLPYTNESCNRIVCGHNSEMNKKMFSHGMKHWDIRRTLQFQACSLTSHNMMILMNNNQKFVSAIGYEYLMSIQS